MIFIADPFLLTSPSQCKIWLISILSLHANSFRDKAALSPIAAEPIKSLEIKNDFIAIYRRNASEMTRLLKYFFADD